MITGPPPKFHAIRDILDGRTLATTSRDKTVILWDLVGRNQPRQLGQPLTGHPIAVSGVAFAPDGRTLATAGNDLRLWDVADRHQPRQLGQPITAHNLGVWTVAFAPDGRTLVTASADKTIILWDLPRSGRFPDGEVREACIRAGGPLDKTTWDQYVPGISYQDTCTGH